MEALREVIHYIGNLDRQFFLFLNGLHAGVLDDFFIVLSNKWVWIPLYAFLFYVIIRKFGWKSIYIVLAVVALITLSDQISVHVFKNVVQRLRPCHDPRLIPYMHIVDGCGGKYGFVSSHAANVFALAVFFARLLWDESRWYFFGLFLWAFLVSYSRIYLGVHYPMDIACGAIIGAALAFLVFRLLDHFWPRQQTTLS